ncbi:MAG: hypothetical protein AAF558_12460 [Verrucomicrobiota bacterium]
MLEEIQSVMQGKTVIPLQRPSLRFTGADRHRYLNGQTTNDVTNLTPGHARHAAVCNAKGKMQGEIWIGCDSECLLVDFPEPLSDSLPTRLEKYIIADDVEVEAPDSRLVGFHLIAPEEPTIPDSIYTFASTRFGEDGWDIWFLETPSLPNSIPQASRESIDWFRIQQGIPQWGTDIDESNLPPEAYREKETISYQKGCYIGQEIIARIKSIGKVKRKLCLVSGTTPLSPSTEILDGDRVIGHISSCQQKANDTSTVMAIAMVRQPFCEPGQRLTISGSSWSVERALPDNLA